jgi:catechol 2,3-dioxygenase-like lactoylglutathione lyase family enzyme
MFDHVTLQVSDIPTSQAFYETVLAPLGIAPGHIDGEAVGFFGPEPGSFWLTPAEAGTNADDQRELHIAFRAPSRQHVRQVHAAAVATGIEVLHAPRIFPEYHENYYGTFVRDPDGHNIEAVCTLPGGDDPASAPEE